MRAVVISQPGDAAVLHLVDRPVPQHGANEVLIQVKAAGVNRPDISQRKGHYPPPPGASPDIPGLEVAGVIEACGSEVQRWKPGDRVCALTSGGGYAEYAAVPAGQCLPLPQGLGYLEAASLPETYFTVWHNVFQRGGLIAGEHFLVQGGSGGIGTTAIQLGRAFGSRVFATAGTDAKCRACESLGAIQCINYHDQDFESTLQSEGIDLILDSIGGDYFAAHIRLLRDEGRLVFINSVRGNKTELDIRTIMQKRLLITGSMLRSRSVLFKTQLAAEVEKCVWPLFGQKMIHPVIFARLPLGEAAEAHRILERSDHVGKIMLTME